jgi:PKD repeat protein
MKPIYVVLLTVAVLTMQGCYPEPVANFDFSYTDNTAPALVSFSNYSTDAEEYQWNFGDGNTSTSHSPTHTYEEGGTFTISLTATGRGGDNTMPKSITIIQPTSYIFRNNSSVTLYTVLTFYFDGDKIFEETTVEHGTMPSGSMTDEVITEHPTVDVAFSLADGTMAWVVETFTLTPNALTYVDFDDYTNYLVINSETKDNNSMEDLQRIRKNGKVMQLKDLLGQ